MSNGYKDKDGYELSRNSTRHASVNLSIQQAQDFHAVTELWAKAVNEDRELVQTLANDKHIVVEEAARRYYENENEKPELPTDWRKRVLDMQPYALILRSQRPR